MESIWLINGLTGTGVDPADRGLAYGDGLFETMAAVAGRIRRLDYHLERLLEGCRALGIGPLDEAELRAELAAHTPPSGRAVVKLIVTRGSGPRGYLPPPHSKPTRIVGIDTWPEHPRTYYTRGVKVGICGLRLASNPRLAGLKHLNRLEQVLARMEWREGWQEGLLIDTDGNLVGGTMSNLFTVHGDQIETPELSRAGVRGVMRRAVIEMAAELGLACEAHCMPVERLDDADEVFLTNSLFEIWPVSECQGRRYAVGAVTRRLMQSLKMVA